MRRPVAATLAAALALAGCAGPDTGSASARSPVRIGALYPTGGAQGAEGTEELHGAQLAVEWANAHGGLHGRTYELVTQNAERAEAVPAAMGQLEHRHVTVIVGSHGSAISDAAGVVASARHLSLWETGAVGETSPTVAGGRNFFRMAPMGANLGQRAISFVRDQLAPKLPDAQPLRYAVAYVDDPYGRAVGLGAVEELRRSGQALVGSFPYDAAHADFETIAAAIASSGADVLFVSAYLQDGVALRRALVTHHAPLLATIGTSSSYCMPQFGAMLDQESVGVFASDKPDAPHVNRTALAPEGAAALDWVQPRYEKRWHVAMSAPALSGFANTYALLVHILPTAGTTDPARVAAAGLATKLADGTLANGGGLDIAAPSEADAGNNRRAASVIWEWVAPRTRAVVWPPTFATHPIVALPLDGSPRPWPANS